MGYQGLALFLAAVVGIGFAVYHYYNQGDTAQTHRQQSRSYNYVYDPPETDDSQPNARTRSRRHRRAISGHEKCAICQDLLSQNITYLPCYHYFHNNCIQLWLNERRTCPICRKSV